MRKHKIQSAVLCLQYLGKVEKYLNGEGDDVHAGDAPVTATD